MQLDSPQEGDDGRHPTAVAPFLASLAADHLSVAMEISASAAVAAYRQQLALDWATAHVHAAAVSGESETDQFSLALLQSTAATFADAANMNITKKGDISD